MITSFKSLGQEGGGGGGGDYHLPTATATRLGGVKIGEGITVAADGTINSQGAATDNITTEIVENKLQSNAIIKVNTLPSANIKEKSLYGIDETVSYDIIEWTYDGKSIDYVPNCYKSISENVTVNTESITFTHSGTTTSTPWNEVNDVLVDSLVENGYIQLTDFGQSTFCGLNGKYDHKSKFTNTVTAKSFTMHKTFKRDGNDWNSTSIISITDEEYSHLSETQKMDGTVYVINDLTPVITDETSYNILSDKPKINSITLQGSLSLEDLNLYSRLEINNLLADKGQVEFVNQLPSTPNENTWYYSKKFEDGTDVPNDKRALYIVLDDITEYNYMGVVGDIDLSEYYSKQQVDNLLNQKQDLLSNDTAYSSPADADNLADVNLSTKKVKRITFANIWSWIVGKLTANTEKGIKVSGGKLGHTNNITVPTAKRILQATYDAQGHITAIENEFNWSNTYNTSAENQLFTRKGANDMYTNYLKSTNGKLTKSTAITADYSHYVKCGNIYQLSIGFQNGSDIAKDALLYTLPESIANNSIEMYIVISTINGDSKILQTGGSSGNNQIKAKQAIPSGYWFGSAIFIKV